MLIVLMVNRLVVLGRFMCGGYFVCRLELFRLWINPGCGAFRPGINSTGWGAVLVEAAFAMRNKKWSANNLYSVMM